MCRGTVCPSFCARPASFCSCRVIGLAFGVGSVELARIMIVGLGRVGDLGIRDSRL
jgi:hypothetical protein